MSGTDVERLATLESEMRGVKQDVSDIKASLKALEKIAASGGGAFHAILMLGGMIGWLVGLGVAVYSALHH